MNTEQLKQILDSHSLWLRTNGAEGKRANLTRADLRGANLEGANLVGANLNGTILDMKKEEEASGETSNSNLRAKFDEFAKSLGLEIVSLKVKQSQEIDL